MQTRPTLTMLLTTGLLLGACSAPRSRDEAPPLATRVRPVSQSAMSVASHAHQEWASIRRTPLSSSAWIEAQQLVLDQLSRAATNDPECCLLQTLRGRVALELALAERAPAASAAHLETAYASFRAALAGKPEWTPGWLGLAELHVCVGQPAAARDALRSARASLEALENFESWTLRSMQAEHYGGSGGGSASARELPEPSPQERFALLTRWIDVEASWRIDTADIPDVASDEASANGRLRRLRARIELQDARITAAEVDYDASEATRVLAAYDEALRWDPDLAEARIESALWCARAGDPDRALGRAEPFLGGRYPLLTHNRSLLRVVADAHAELYSRTGKLAEFHDAAHYYARLSASSEDDSDVQLAFARHLLNGAERQADVAVARNAQQVISRIEASSPERAELEQRLEPLLSAKP